MNIAYSDFGKTPQGKRASLITLENRQGMKLILSDFGARIVCIEYPVNGKMAELTTRFASPGAYAAAGRYHGAVIGRYANRIGGAEFTLSGKRYTLEKNDGENTLHGGNEGFDTKLWEYEISGAGVAFTLVSPHMEGGYPGTLYVRTEYTLSDDGTVDIAYFAHSDRDTVLNLTNHAYFNLDGFARDAAGHTATIDADSYTPPDDTLIPTGSIAAVKGTPLDFTSPHRIGERIGDELLAIAGGYDHNYALNGTGFRRCALVEAEQSSIAMEVYTDMPGMQFYTGNFLCSERGESHVYVRHGAFCMETQRWPDSPNKPAFPSAVIRTGEQFKSRTSYRFFTR